MAEKILSEDILTRREVSDLLFQHVAIRSQMRFLIKGLNDISLQSKLEIAPSTNLNEQISLYCYLLDDFQEAIKRHNELHEHIQMLHSDISSAEIMIEKREIEEQLDNLVTIAHNAVYNELHRDELNKCVSDIVEGVNRIYESIDVHIARVERLLEWQNR